MRLENKNNRNKNFGVNLVFPNVMHFSRIYANARWPINHMMTWNLTEFAKRISKIRRKNRRFFLKCQEFLLEFRSTLGKLQSFGICEANSKDARKNAKHFSVASYGKARDFPVATTECFAFRTFLGKNVLHFFRRMVPAAWFEQATWGYRQGMTHVVGIQLQSPALTNWAKPGNL